MRLVSPYSIGRYLLPVRPDVTEIEQLLTQKFSYFTKLNGVQKNKFLERLLTFLSDKEFQTRDGLELTQEMCVLISATAIQLTFGLDEYLFPHFDTIIIYPDVYFSKSGKNYHKGEVNLSGMVVLSWKHFESGNALEDGVNLGLHEWAHVLRFDTVKNESYDEFFKHYYDKWCHLSMEEFKKIKRGSPSIFRKYGGENQTEFLAVCIEVFFEQPQFFKESLPELYGQTAILLNQDPAEKIFDGIDLRKDIYDETKINLGPPVLDLGYDYSLPGLWIVIPFVFIFPLLVEPTLLKGFLAFSIALFIFLVINNRIKKVMVHQNGISVKSFVPFKYAYSREINFNKIFSISFEQEDTFAEGEEQVSFLATIEYIDQKELESISIELDDTDSACAFIRAVRGKMVALKIKSRLLLNAVQRSIV